MRKKDNENRLESAAKLELQKTQELVNSDLVRGQIKDFLNNKLRKDIVLRDELLKDGTEPSKQLMDRIEGRQEALDELVATIETQQNHLLSTYDIAKIAIARLRKYNPKKANELENSLALKVKQSGSQTIKKKRI
ncbi:hypothetical protein QTG64_001313 [Vibrio vulnificus]|nr:hypothetical protein [Vibrio vulnificus]